MMGKVCLAVITGAALFAAADTATAQGTGTGSGSSSTASKLCWDVSTSMVRDSNPTDTNSSKTSSNSGKTEDGASSDASKTVGSTSTRDPKGTGIARPAGMPDC
jgi:hypothetical protein